MEETKINETNRESMDESSKKICNSIITKLRRSTKSTPFLQPVDPVALGIPDYYEKIKNPMDISTIKAKLDKDRYADIEEFHKDFDLMFQNCYLYNPPDTVVYVMGKELEKIYLDLYSDAFKQQKKKKRDEDSEAESGRNKKTVKLSAKNETIESKERVSLDPEEYRWCSNVLSELEKPKHKKFTWPFLEPVKKEDVPDYYDVIKNPVDISTMRKRLEEGYYGKREEFIQDLNRMVKNCRIFNAPGSEVNECGDLLNQLIQELVSTGKNLATRIHDLRTKISALTQELRTLESQASNKSNKKMYTIEERESIGRAILAMSHADALEIASIVQKYGTYEYIDHDEIEINLHTMPDDTVAAIEDYLKNTNRCKNEA